MNRSRSRSFFSDFFTFVFTTVPPNSVRSSVIHQEEENVKVILSEITVIIMFTCEYFNRRSAFVM
jgi:hypothetical protein